MAFDAAAMKGTIKDLERTVGELNEYLYTKT